MAATNEAIDTLLGVLGSGMSRQHAARLLQDAEGSLDTAIALHFAGGGPAAGGASTSAAAAAGGSSAGPQVSQLRAVLGAELPQAYLQHLLRR